MPSNKYPTSSKNRLLSPLFLSSEILFKGFIIPAEEDVRASEAFPFDRFDGEPSGVADCDLVGVGGARYGSSSELSTPQRVRREL